MSEILNKKALAESLAEKLEMTKKDAGVAVDTVFEEITAILAKGGKVEISGFGKFEVAERPERMGIKPLQRNRLKLLLQKPQNSKLLKL